MFAYEKISNLFQTPDNRVVTTILCKSTSMKLIHIFQKGETNEYDQRKSTWDEQRDR